MCLNVAGQHWVPVSKTWRLNERLYGALQGCNKDDALRELDIDQEWVMEMRRSYNTPPPRMDDDHPYWHGNDRRYAKLTSDQLERSRCESLKDAAERIMPFFNSVIVPSLREGNRCLVVSHANTIRTLIKQIDNIPDQDIKQLSIPKGIPLIYRLEHNMRPVDPNCELEFRYLVRPKGYTWATSLQHGFHGVYLGDLERLQDIEKKRDATNRGWQRVILRNIARQSNEEDIKEDGNRYHKPNFHRDGVVETKHLWWKIVQKMQNPEVSAFHRLVPRHICLLSCVHVWGWAVQYSRCSRFMVKIDKIDSDRLALYRTLTHCFSFMVLASIVDAVRQYAPAGSYERRIDEIGTPGVNRHTRRYSKRYTWIRRGRRSIRSLAWKIGWIGRRGRGGGSRV